MKSSFKGIDRLAIITDFSWNNCISIIGFRFFNNKNEFFGDETIFETTIIYQGNNNNYKIIANFINIESLQILVDHREIQLDLFSITDIREDGWCTLNYWVKDIESEDISFYCNDIEIISVEQI
ncbi:hypothetical protein E0485_05780 [Paenibacillus albiflavus]|uniref:Uncharacterized protein n=1 Tax=Paenibacillus albiflavus TaxID=2545760 RepID=A0A4R4EJD6_9BACL|nr:hypothetical protein [Paenibacillus albiflavus]TCZ79370.1 hypothetical protein E0485_05780 [Paenibacillus albiflavus]